MADHITKAEGVSVDENGRIVARYVAPDGTRVSIDLTAVMEKVAENAIQAHMTKYHGHQI